MKTLSTDAAAAALGVERKTLDNVLAREGRSLIDHGVRGRSRRIPVDVLERVAAALILNRDLGVSVAKGLELAEQVFAAPDSTFAAGSLITLMFDVRRLKEVLELSIDEALESVAEHRRGRPVP
jgi:hypothetical protein